MKIRDKIFKKYVDVSDRDCSKRPCYWPRPDPGVFSQGQGYKSRIGNTGWICGTREIRGCPDDRKHLPTRVVYIQNDDPEYVDMPES